jgi:hypothetical protein
MARSIKDQQRVGDAVPDHPTGPAWDYLPPPRRDTWHQPADQVVVLKFEVTGPTTDNLARIADAVYQAAHVLIGMTVTTVDDDTYEITAVGFPLAQDGT